MTTDRWQRIKSLFAAALSLTAEERDDFLKRECPDAPGLQAEVRRLLENDSIGSDLLELGNRPAPSQSFAPDELAGGRFRIVRLLGRGGMGEVYEAEDTLLGERLALKAIRPEIASAPGSLSRFRQEIHLARRVTHSNVCRIFDLEIHTGDTGRDSVFLTMELLSGETLAARLERSGLLPPDEALALARQMGAGLQAAHQCGIVHRDFKTSNVMLVPGKDSSCRAVITDFGLARANLDSASTKLTGSGNILGTPDYMAPEQLERGESSFRSDIYSFGLVLYEMVTGALPLAGNTPLESALRRVRETPPSPRTLHPELSRAWETAIAGCLQKDPSRRFAAAAEVVNALESNPAKDSWRRYAIWASCIVLLGLLSGAVVFHPYAPNRARTVTWKPVPLTSYPGREFQPALSPDGELVAFSWDGEKQDNLDIYVKQIASGAVSRLTTDPAPETSPAWSPDGRLIAFRRLVPDANQIILKSYLGGPERRLAQWPCANSRHLEFLERNRNLSFSSDGKWLATQGCLLPESAGLLAVSVETGQATKLTSPSGKFIADSAPALSPDGGLLAFMRATTSSVSELYILALSGQHPVGPPRQITFDNRNATNPVWTPDGRSIIFSSNREKREAEHHLWRVLISGSGGAVKASEPELLAGIGDFTNGPSISRNGRRLAYSQESHDLNIWELHLSENASQTATTSRVVSSTRDDVFPDYSPDGRKIVFGSDRSGHHEIWVCDRDGSNSVQLTSSAGPNTDPHWAPDGMEIAFSSRAQENRSEIYVISAQGGAPRRITYCPADCIGPNWSRDGKWIYFSTRPNAIRQIWKIPARGGNAIQVTKGLGIYAQESVDRKYLYYSTGRDYQGSVWKVPVEGGAEVQVLPSVTYRNFALTDQGIYFIPGLGRQLDAVNRSRRDNAVIQFYSFATGTVKTVFTTEKPIYRGLVASPDGHSLLYTQFDRQDTDLWLIDNFQ